MKNYASQIEGVDIDAFVRCVEDQATLEQVQISKQIGIQLGVRGTPYTAIIDTRSGAFMTLGGVQSVESVQKYIEVFLTQ